MIRVVAFGGGHGLAASLRALRLLRQDLDLDITAVVTVGDDGGSSGRLRAERGGLPPGDLRQALAALADPADPVAGRTADLLQHRFGGNDPLGGSHGRQSAAVRPDGADRRSGGGAGPRRARWSEQSAGSFRCREPHSPSRRPYAATTRARPDLVGTVYGQHAVAVTRGVVEDVRLTPAEPVACTEAIDAVTSADWLVFGPGSWYTSVIPHLLVPELAAAIARSPARRLVTLNLAVEPETAGLSLPDHLRALARYLPGLRVDVVLADGKLGDGEPVGDAIGLQTAAESLRARVLLAPVAVPHGGPRHDPAALARALHEVLDPDTGHPARTNGP